MRRTWSAVCPFLAIALAALVVASPSPARAADGDATVIRSGLGETIDRAIQRSTNGGFWGSVLVAKDGEILLARGYGHADYAARDNTPATQFELASASKPITAAAVLHLAEGRKLDLDDTLADVFGRRAVPADKADITVHQLLTHTSGMSPEAAVPYAWPRDRDEYLRVILQHPLATEPGATFAYCNAGYALLAAVVEEASGKSFEDYCRRHLFRPAGMTDSGFIQDEELVNSDRIAYRLADGQPETATAADWHWGWGYRGMGGVVSTVRDLYRWDRALRDDTVLADDSRKTLFTPAQAGYACGWLVRDSPQGRKAMHGGAVAGYRTMISRWLETDAVIIILSNEATNEREVEATIAAELFPEAKLTAAIDVGPYERNQFNAVEIAESLTVSVARDGDRVTITLRDTSRRHEVATISLPVFRASGLARELAAAIATRQRGPQGPDRTNGACYLGGYTVPRNGQLTLDDNLGVGVQAEYTGVDPDGGEIVDHRVVVIVADRDSGQWPIMLHLSLADARRLQRELAAD